MVWIVSGFNDFTNQAFSNLRTKNQLWSCKEVHQIPFAPSTSVPHMLVGNHCWAHAVVRISSSWQHAVLHSGRSFLLLSVSSEPSLERILRNTRDLTVWLKQAWFDVTLLTCHLSIKANLAWQGKASSNGVQQPMVRPVSSLITPTDYCRLSQWVLYTPRRPQLKLALSH